MANFCSAALPYHRLYDVIQILVISVEQYKVNAVPILEASYPHLLPKAIETPLPNTNVTDAERHIIKLHDKMIQLIVSAVENLGPALIFNETLSAGVEPATDWMLTILVQTQAKTTQQMIIKIAKSQLMVLKGVSPQAGGKLVQVLLSSKSKKHWP